MEERPAAASHAQGYIVVLIGLLGFAVSCFLPYLEAVGGGSRSLYQLIIQRDDAHSAVLAAVGGLLNLLAGPATIALISLAALKKPRTWVFPALAAVSIVWSLTWVGILLNAYGFFSTTPGVGYWLIAFSIAVVVLGTILVGLSIRARHRRQARGAVIEEPH
jgi:hypothetical protein